jgi:hypothetical protein
MRVVNFPAFDCGTVGVAVQVFVRSVKSSPVRS